MCGAPGSGSRRAVEGQASVSLHYRLRGQTGQNGVGKPGDASAAANPGFAALAAADGGWRQDGLGS